MVRKCSLATRPRASGPCLTYKFFSSRHDCAGPFGQAQAVLAAQVLQAVQKFRPSHYRRCGHGDLDLGPGFLNDLNPAALFHQRRVEKTRSAKLVDDHPLTRHPLKQILDCSGMAPRQKLVEIVEGRIHPVVALRSNRHDVMRTGLSNVSR